MASTKFENLWKLLSEYNFEIVDRIIDGVLCTLCGRLMIEPYVAQCGCQYCRACIVNYVHGDVKHCPGQSESCALELLEIDKNIVIDYRARLNIANTIVKCIKGSCSFKDKLEKMEEHIPACLAMSVNCPYRTIGCTNSNVSPDNVDDHLRADMSVHSRLLIEIVDRLRCDVNDLMDQRKRDSVRITKTKREMVVLKGLIGELGNDCEKNGVVIVGLREELQQVERKREADRLHIQMLRDEINRLKECGGMESRTENGHSNEGVIVEMKKEISDMQQTMVRRECDMEVTREKLREMEPRMKMELDGVKEETDTLKGSFGRMATMILGVAHTFVWTITEISKKTGWHVSDSFSQDHYQFCLRLLVGKCFLRSHVNIMKGEEDDMAGWPMVHSVTLRILNRETMQEFACGDCSYHAYDGDRAVFGRPTGAINGDIIGPTVYLRDAAAREWLSHDSVTLCCSLLPPPC